MKHYRLRGQKPPLEVSCTICRPGQGDFQQIFNKEAVRAPLAEDARRNLSWFLFVHHV